MKEFDNYHKSSTDNSITYRVANGPYQGKTLKKLPEDVMDESPSPVIFETDPRGTVKCRIVDFF